MPYARLWRLGSNVCIRYRMPLESGITYIEQNFI